MLTYLEGKLGLNCVLLSVEKPAMVCLTVQKLQSQLCLADYQGCRDSPEETAPLPCDCVIQRRNKRSVCVIFSSLNILKGIFINLFLALSLLGEPYFLSFLPGRLLRYRGPVDIQWRKKD